ncbi:FKBP-type peptidyl-prolyl cis-trans isomerase [Ekhidna sp.]|uniref:FKBP-type peptidyl-prolyl cis-trans isomerase n=1 Tax=Ekhidna sp. TaxID=2608089 RepID=UPI0035116FD2
MKRIILVFTLATLVLFMGCKEEDELTDQQQLEVDIAAIDNYLSENEIVALTHESEIRYQIFEEGSGETPTIDDNVIVKYIGSFLDGRVFDQNQLGLNFLIKDLIEAWKIMLPEMKEGGKIKMYVPSIYGYGKRGNTFIPPNTILVFEVELVSIVLPAEDQLVIDLEKIDQYLNDNDIVAIKHSSGIRYQIITDGTGKSPIISDNITVNYIGEFFSGDVFDEGNLSRFRLSELITSWKNMLPLIKEDGEIIFYAPSGLCYGNTGSGPVPPNTNLIYKVELISVD